MDKEELTEEQIRLFLKYGTIPAGYSKEEIEELSGRNDQKNVIRGAYRDRLLGVDVYHFCEVCNSVTTTPFYPPGQRMRGRYNTSMREQKGDNKYNPEANSYCYICHKSMCEKCKAGIVCKDCIEFFPEPTKKKVLKRHKLYFSLNKIFFPIIVLCAISNFLPLAFPDVNISHFLLLAITFTSILPLFISFYIIHKFFEDTTVKFMNGLKEHPDKELVKKINALYYDSYDHPENLSGLNNPFFMGVFIIFPVLIILFTFLNFQ